MNWHTDPPRQQGEYLVVDSWCRREVATWRPDLGWCVRGKWVGRGGVQCWTDGLPEIPAFAARGKW